MTVASTSSKIPYTGNGVTTVFAFPYPFVAASDIQVYVAGVLKTLTTDYTISGTAPYPSGANITFVSAPANGASIVIARVVPYTQTLDLVPNDPLPADSVEQRLDLNVMMVQQLLEQLGRAITIPITDVTGTNQALPAAATRANQTLIFDSVGNVTVGSISTVAVSVAMQPVVQAASLSAARTAMGLGSAATQNTGTSGANVPLLNGNNTWSGSNTFSTQVAVNHSGVPLIVNSTGSSTNKILLQDNGVTVGNIGAAAGFCLAAGLAAGTVVGGWDNSGNLLPNVDATYNVGSVSQRWSQIFSNFITSSAGMISGLQKRGGQSFTSNASLNDISGASVNLVAGHTYIFTATLVVINGAGGCRFGIGGTAGNGGFRAVITGDQSGTYVGNGAGTGSTGLLYNNASTANANFVVHGYISCTSSGTFTIQGGQNTSNAAATNFNDVMLDVAMIT